MIDRQRLLSDLQKLLNKLEADLLERADSTDVPEIGSALRSEYDRARQAERTAQSYEEWKSDTVTQIAAAWVLSCVFVRFLEDNRLIDPPKIAGLADRLQRARDEHELYFRSHSRETDRDYLLAVFDDLAKLPGTKDVFGEHNPIRELPKWLSGDAAGELLAFFQKIDANTGTLVHDFTDSTWDTRFLGDLYQELSEAARKKYALLQTPEFVEEFILDRTLEPALDEFGLDAAPVKDTEGKPTTPSGFRMMDPACGSGHFVLGAFRRILNRWLKQEPGAKIRELVQRALDSVHGVDLNPYAVAIARFRLLLASMQACGITHLAEAPAFHLNLACGDSLLHGTKHQGFIGDWLPISHYFQSEDIDTLRRLLRPSQYHAVVANPPYITPKDRALNDAYRERYRTCYRQYSLAVPFMERIFQLADTGGFTGQITANSFMKREFGKKLIEEFLPRMDLTHVIDTSGAYIPGHGTPTVILFGRNHRPVASTIRTLMGIRGEPGTPDNPSRGVVWSAIEKQIDQPGSASDFISVADTERELFASHPWSIGGGGAAELKQQLDEECADSLGTVVGSIGFFQDTHADEAFVQPMGFSARHGIREGFKPQIRGDNIRDWSAISDEEILFPYNDNLTQWVQIPRLPEWSWLFALRTYLWERSTFGGGTYKSAGRSWYDYHQFPKDRARTPMSIVFAFVATHNHFAFDRGGKVFNRSAPVIKLLSDATEDHYLALLGILNSSTACFWMKQVSHDKGSTVDSHGARQTTVAFENFREFTGTGLLKFPLPQGRPVRPAKQLDALAQRKAELTPESVLAERYRRGKHQDSVAVVGLRESLSSTRPNWEQIHFEMVSLQEELDWECYSLYGVLNEEDRQDDSFSLNATQEIPPLQLGQRAFEILLARSVARGDTQTSWFQRHNSTPITELPLNWPASYQLLVQRRINVIETNPQIALIEQPEYKRRWNSETWAEQLTNALQGWLLDRLETYFDFDGRMNDEVQSASKLDIAVTSIARLADVARVDADFMEVAELYCDDAAFDVYLLIAQLIDCETVPLLPVLRCKDSGLRKLSEWERTWNLQRHEDALDARTEMSRDNPEYLSEDQAHELRQHEVGDIPVPPKYTSGDFLKSGYWRLRGKIDVPKERWVSFPHCEGPDGTLVIAWAGYDHLQLAKTISTYYVDIQERFGGREDPRLVPLLACVIELLPWIKQWHNDPSPDFDGKRMGDYFEGFVQEEARQMGKTIAEIKAWQPPPRARSRRTRG